MEMVHVKDKFGTDFGLVPLDVIEAELRSTPESESWRPKGWVTETINRIKSGERVEGHTMIWELVK